MGKTAKRLKLSQFTARFVGAPYRLGGQRPAEGLDCLSLILEAARHRRIPVSDEFEGVTRETYAELWETDREGAKKKLLRFVLSLGEEIPPSMAFAGDLLIIKPKKGGNGRDRSVLGIHAGNDLVLSSFTDAGVRLANLQDCEIVRAIRWEKR